MKRTLLGFGFLLGLACATLMPTGTPPPGVVILTAQSVPAMVHFQFDPPVVDVMHDPATQFAITVDGGTPTTVAASTCTPRCSVPVTLGTFGPHTFTTTAQYEFISGTATSLLNGGSATVAARLNQASGPPLNPTVTN